MSDSGSLGLGKVGFPSSYKELTEELNAISAKSLDNEPMANDDGTPTVAFLFAW